MAYSKNIRRPWAEPTGKQMHDSLQKDYELTHSQVPNWYDWNSGSSSGSNSLNLGVATPSEFEPLAGPAGSNVGIKAPTHQDTSHIGAEERATGSAVGGTVGGIVAAMMGLPPQVGVAAGSALGGGGSVGETATSALGGYADEIKPGDEGKIKDFLKKGTDVPDVWGHPAR